jgi:hypothetical protein
MTPAVARIGLAWVICAEELQNQVILWHSQVNTTEVYAQVNTDRGKELARLVGWRIAMTGARSQDRWQAVGDRKSRKRNGFPRVGRTVGLMC